MQTNGTATRTSATFGDLLRRYRLAAGLTQQELAERARLSPRAISDLERGRRTRPWRNTIQFLADALGLGGAERAWFEAVARRSSLSSPEPPAPKVSSERDIARNNLPVSLTPLIGRERETIAVLTLQRRSDVRLVTLNGPGGIGKTRLALQVAADLSDDFEDGVFFVSLAPIGDPRLVAPTIAQVLGVKETAGQSPIQQLKEALRGRQLLLVLDNFEHLEPAAPLVAELLAGCPRLKILVTSRSALHLRGEHELAVPPLTLPDRGHLPPPEELLQYEAVRLFLQCARAAKADFSVTSQNAAAVAEICHRLDGLPLAIELAAARIKVLPPAEILGRLGNRFRLLTGGARDLPTRQQTLQSTIAWSYDLLEKGEQMLFRRLTTFIGGCTLAAAEAVGGDLDFDVLDDLTALIDRSLLRQEEVGRETRYSMLETIHEYGLTLLVASGEESVIRERHAAHFLAVVDDCVRQQTSEGPGSRNWDDGLETEQANLRAALAWYRDNDPATGLRLAAGLGWYWVFHDDLVEGEGWLSTFLAQTPGKPAVRGRALLGLATLKRNQGDLDAAQPLYEESLSLCRQVDDRWGIARSLGMLAQQARSAADYEQAIALTEESLAIARPMRVQDSIMWGLFNLAQVHQLQGDLGRARALADEALRMSPHNSRVLNQLVRSADDDGEYDRIEAVLREVLTEARERRAHGDAGRVLLLLGRLIRKRGDRAQARRLFEDSLANARAIGLNVLTYYSLYDLGNLAWADGDRCEAHSRLSEWLNLAQRVGNRQFIALGLLVGAQQAAEDGALSRAVRLFGAADLATPQFRFETDFFDLADYERILVAARAALDAEAFASAWAEGQSMTLEQAVAYVLEEVGG